MRRELVLRLLMVGQLALLGGGCSSNSPGASSSVEPQSAPASDGALEDDRYVWNRRAEDFEALAQAGREVAITLPGSFDLYVDPGAVRQRRPWLSDAKALLVASVGPHDFLEVKAGGQELSLNIDSLVAARLNQPFSKIDMKRTDQQVLDSRRLNRALSRATHNPADLYLDGDEAGVPSIARVQPMEVRWIGGTSFGLFRSLDPEGASWLINLQYLRSAKPAGN